MLSTILPPKGENEALLEDGASTRSLFCFFFFYYIERKFIMEPMAWASCPLQCPSLRGRHRRWRVSERVEHEHGRGEAEDEGEVAQGEASVWKCPAWRSVDDQEPSHERAPDGPEEGLVGEETLGEGVDGRVHERQRGRSSCRT